MLNFGSSILLWMSRICIVSVLLHNYAQIGCALQDASNKVPISDEIVRQASLALDNGKTSNAALTVDRDDNIKLYRWFEMWDRSISGFRVSQYLGRRVNYSGSLSLAGLIPKSEVAANAFRITSDDQRVFHVVL